MQSGDLLFVNPLNVHNEGEHVYYLALVVAIAIDTMPAQTPPYLVPIRYHCVTVTDLVFSFVVANQAAFCTMTTAALNLCSPQI